MIFNVDLEIKDVKTWQAVVGTLHLLHALGIVGEDEYRNTIAQLLECGDFDFSILFD